MFIVIFLLLFPGYNPILILTTLASPYKFGRVIMKFSQEMLASIVLCHYIVLCVLAFAIKQSPNHALGNCLFVIPYM